MIYIIESNQFNKYLRESVLDTTKDVLNPIFWKNDKLKSEIKDAILDAIDSVLDNYDEVYFVGSSTGYNYNEDTDVDIHIIINDITEKEADDLFNKLPTELFFETHPVQFYVEADEEFDEAKGSVYDILNDKWIIKPIKPDFKVPYEYVMEVSKIFMSGIDDRIQELKTDIIDLKFLEDNNEEERCKIKRDEIKADLDSLYMLKNLLYDMRTGSYTGADMNFFKQFGKGNESLQNMVYKMIEKAGYLENIKQYLVLRKKLKDKGFNSSKDVEQINNK